MTEATAQKKIKRCAQCGTEFETIRRRKCQDCRRGAWFGRHDPEKIAAEQARRALPNMTLAEVQQALKEGRRWFTNGGTRWRYVHGIEVLYINYSTSKYYTYEALDRFLKWAKSAHTEKGGSENGK